MKLFPPYKQHEFFLASEREQVINAIRESEKRTSGEIRLYIESRCKYVDPLDRAAEVFWSLKMDHTTDRNAVLVYVALKDHQFAIFADQGIYERVGQEFWKREVDSMSNHFRQLHYMDALLEVIKDIGEALTTHFPYDRATDKNELPDDIIFGK